MFDGFAKRYNIDRLVHYEESHGIRSAIEREKQLKGWLRVRKVALIESTNPEWDDIAEAWYTGLGDSSRSLPSSEAKGSE